ncbi:hypothetical protein [Mesorhizobium sp.]|nr:hypothetical protein [Mesorhizobium sp.]
MSLTRSTPINSPSGSCSLTALLASTLERRLQQAAKVDQRVTILQGDAL